MNKTNGENKHFNLMDVIIILLVLLCIGGIVVRVGGFGLSEKSQPLDMYEIRFSVSDIAATSESAFVIGDTFTLVDYDVVLGTFTGVESVTPAKVYIYSEQGRVVHAQYPDGTRIDVIGTVTADGLSGGSGFLLGGNVQLSPGISYRVQSEHMDFTLNILEIVKK